MRLKRFYRTMPDLIFHIGLPKCASTTLQNQVFRSEEGYLGTATGLPLKENFAKQFQTISPIAPRLRGNMHGAHNWAQRVKRFTERNYPTVSRLILSSEFLSAANSSEPRPIISFLKDFSREVWDEGAVKVLLLLRNPADRLASTYAQRSSRIPNACQDDFERSIEATFSNNRDFFDIAAWVEELYSALGRENVCVLLTEQMANEIFWRSLVQFSELGTFTVEDGMKTTDMNRRATDYGTWKLADYDPWEVAKTQANDIVGLLWPAGRMLKLRHRSKISLARGLKPFYSVSLQRRQTKRQNQIQVTSDLRDQINHRCHSFHEHLGSLLRTDLSHLGY